MPDDALKMALKEPGHAYQAAVHIRKRSAELQANAIANEKGDVAPHQRPETAGVE